MMLGEDDFSPCTEIMVACSWAQWCNEVNTVTLPAHEPPVKDNKRGRVASANNLVAKNKKKAKHENLL